MNLSPACLRIHILMLLSITILIWGSLWVHNGKPQDYTQYSYDNGIWMNQTFKSDKNEGQITAGGFLIFFGLVGIFMGSSAYYLYECNM